MWGGMWGTDTVEIAILSPPHVKTQTNQSQTKPLSFSFSVFSHTVMHLRVGNFTLPMENLFCLLPSGRTSSRARCRRGGPSDRPLDAPPSAPRTLSLSLSLSLSLCVFAVVSRLVWCRHSPGPKRAWKCPGFLSLYARRGGLWCEHDDGGGGGGGGDELFSPLCRWPAFCSE